jgi:hypothetical protein
MRLLITIVFISMACSCWGQTLDSLKLTLNETPEKYKTIDETLCKSIQAKILFDKPEMYSFILGSLKEKTFQSFQSANDEGSILYFEFEEDITEAKGFLAGLVWGGNKPTKEHPEEFIIRDKLLIIWSFSKSSELKNISKEKIERILKK